MNDSGTDQVFLEEKCYGRLAMSEMNGGNGLSRTRALQPSTSRCEYRGQQTASCMKMENKVK